MRSGKNLWRERKAWRLPQRDPERVRSRHGPASRGCLSAEPGGQAARGGAGLQLISEVTSGHSGNVDPTGGHKVGVGWAKPAVNR